MNFTVTLVEPQIPQNTGNVGRLCAATNTKLNIVGMAGFILNDKNLKRAGMDYWESLDWKSDDDIDAYFSKIPREKLFFFSSKAEKSYTMFSYPSDAYFVFGNENWGLPPRIYEKYADRLVKIPMANNGTRCLNLANSVAIALYEGLRQYQFEF